MDKNVTLIVGGQYGSEGKGKICGYLSPEFDIAVRIGGPNAGHTVWLGDKEYKFRQLPVAGLINPDCILAIGAGGVINLDVLKEEMSWIDHLDGRLIIDRNAGIIEKQDLEEEVSSQLFELIGSTSKGVGSSLSRKVRRRDYNTAKNIEALVPYTNNVQKYLYTQGLGKRIMIEGTQGYALSLNHGPYPFCTSRDVVAASLLSDVGLSPTSVEDIIMVVRTYPIRVFGNSGPMYEETSWEEVTNASGSPEPILERTTVTNRVRRVGKFDWDLLEEASQVNTPTQVALTFIDYMDYTHNHGATEFDKLSHSAVNFIERVERVAGAPVTLIGTGPYHAQIIDRRREYGLDSNRR